MLDALLIALIFAGGFCVGAICGLLKGRSIYRMTWQEVQKYHA